MELMKIQMKAKSVNYRLDIFKVTLTAPFLTFTEINHSIRERASLLLLPIRVHCVQLEVLVRWASTSKLQVISLFPIKIAQIWNNSTKSRTLELSCITHWSPSSMKIKGSIVWTLRHRRPLTHLSTTTCSWAKVREWQGLITRLGLNSTKPMIKSIF